MSDNANIQPMTNKPYEEPTAEGYPSMHMPTPPKGSPTIGCHPDGEGNSANEYDPKDSSVPPPPDGVKRILIGVPILDISYEFFMSFMKFWNELVHAKEDYEVGYHFVYRRPVHMAEEEIVKIAQYNKCTHLLFMDDDIFDVSKADLDKLLAADKDVIGGVMHASKFPHAMCVFRRYDRDKKVIDMPVDKSLYRLYEVPCICPSCQVQLSHWDAKFCPACGCGVDNLIQQADLIPFAFTLIKMSVFDKIKTPWFHCTTNYPTDSWFADRLIEAGMTEYGHMGVRLNHNGVNDLSKPHLLAIGQAKARLCKAIVEITPEQMETHQRLLLDKMLKTEESVRAKPSFHKGGNTVANAPEEDDQDLTINTKAA